MPSELIPVGHTFGAQPAMSTRQALTQIIRDIPGVGDVRLLASASRPGGARHKVFIVLDTHDVDRDRHIIEILCQLDDVDIDLVPKAAAAMIPDAAESLLH